MTSNRLPLRKHDPKGFPLKYGLSCFQRSWFWPSLVLSCAALKYTAKHLTTKWAVFYSEVRDLYNEVACITNGFGGSEHFVIKVFNCRQWEPKNAAAKMRLQIQHVQFCQWCKPWHWPKHARCRQTFWTRVGPHMDLHSNTMAVTLARGYDFTLNCW